MSLDSIIDITIDTKTLQMAQAGFGTPLIIAEHAYLKHRVQSFRTLVDVYALTQGHEAQEKTLPDEKKFEKSALYKAAEAILSQRPCVRKIKIGKRDAGKSVIEALETISQEDSDGDFYGVLLLSDHADRDYPDLASAVATRRLLAGVDIGKTEKDLALAKSLAAISGARRLFLMFKENSEEYPAAAWMGKMLAQPPGSASWAFKELSGIKKSKLNSSTEDALKTAHINHHIDINKQGITLEGKVLQGEFIDVIHGIDWLHVRMQERLLRLFVLNNKIPYTAKGIDLVRCEIMAQLSEGVRNGLLAADPVPEVTIPEVEDIAQAEREKRMLPNVCFNARLAGAIHYIEIRGTVTA